MGTLLNVRPGPTTRVVVAKKPAIFAGTPFWAGQQLCFFYGAYIKMYTLYEKYCHVPKLNKQYTSTPLAFIYLFIYLFLHFVVYKGRNIGSA